MLVTAKLKHLRIAPRKVRLVADQVRGKSVEEAQAILNFTIKRGAKDLLKLLKSAAENAKNNFQLDPINLYIKKFLVDEGIKYKRWMPRARGQATLIQKKTSQVTLILDEINPSLAKASASAEASADKSEEKKVVEIKERPKFTKSEREKFIPKAEKGGGLKRIFRRKAF